MTTAMPRLQCFLAEWYRSGTSEEAVDGTAAALQRAGASMTDEGSPVTLLSLLAIPTDEGPVRAIRRWLGTCRRRDVRPSRYPRASAHRGGQHPRRWALPR
jgi:hypothetical protein